jgi:hypothetical protein
MSGNGEGEGGEEVYQESQHGKPSRSRVDAETLSYLKEIDGHFGTLTDDEERQLLVSRVIEELQGPRTCLPDPCLWAAPRPAHGGPQAPPILQRSHCFEQLPELPGRAQLQHALSWCQLHSNIPAAA